MSPALSGFWAAVALAFTLLALASCGDITGLGEEAATEDLCAAAAQLPGPLGRIFPLRQPQIASGDIQGLRQAVGRLELANQDLRRSPLQSVDSTLRPRADRLVVAARDVVGQLDRGAKILDLRRSIGGASTALSELPREACRGQLAKPGPADGVRQLAKKELCYALARDDSLRKRLTSLQGALARGAKLLELVGEGGLAETYASAAEAIDVEDATIGDDFGQKVATIGRKVGLCDEPGA